jgi:carbamoylphosphate synthase large subunit
MACLLITGVGGPAGRNVAQLLLARGHTVIGADMRDVTIPDVRCYRVPAAHAGDYLDVLRDIASAELITAIVPTVSEELPIMADHRNHWGEVQVMIGPSPAVRLANDKYLTCQCLARESVTVPRYMLPSQAGSQADIAGRIGWPCISKPRIGRGGREVVLRCEDDWPEVIALDDHYILQEFMSGTDYAPELFLNSHGQAVVVVLEKTKLKGGLVGNAESVLRVVAPDVADLALAAARALGLVGPVDVDIRRGADGRPAVLEVNARFGANIAHAPEVLDALLADCGLSLGQVAAKLRPA